MNGLPIYDCTARGEMCVADLGHHQAELDTYQTDQPDICGTHAGQADDYHYYMTPVCMIAQTPIAGPDAIIGWALAGFPIYGDLNPDGSEIPEAAPDLCNGLPDGVFGYRHCPSVDAPFVVQCVMTKVVHFDALPGVGPLEPMVWFDMPEPGRPSRRGGGQSGVHPERR